MRSEDDLCAEEVFLLSDLIPQAMQPALYASTPDDLAHAVQLMSDSEFVALDTEFMRESTYYPRLCLIQAATAECCVLIDPLAIADLGVLWDFLLDRKRLKVLHAARQDLETLSLALARARPGMQPGVPGPLFDTQIAAAMLGHASQIGYGGLVAARLDHVLAKGQARTDWTRRPLNPEQLSYAADDVRYLVPLYHNLRNALEAAGRTPWASEENAALEDPQLYRTEPQDAWRRLKGLDRLQADQRACAKLLAAWRESRAMKSDKPRGWILSDEALREVAERRPRSLEDLAQIRSLAEGTIKRQGEEIMRLVAAGQLAAAGENETKIPPRPEPQQLARVTRLMNLVRAEAENLQIAPELLATRRDAEQLVYSGHDEHLRKGWRREVIGERLIALAAQS
jgi:ribonuclease D